jgi:phospholipid/cholesterol/gamma-HCH transport system substrate-binding protein
MTERLPGLKFLIFGLVCVAFTGWLAIQIGNISFESRTEYAAQFDDVQGLLINDEVKISGVTLGRVESIDHLPGGVAEVTFSLRDDIAIPEDSEIVVRWKNVFGLRFLYVEPGEGGTRAEEGHTFGVSQTRAPADLGSLLQRLTPFIQALEPELQNQVLQGLSEGLVGREDRVQDLISQGATLTQRVATREAEIESLLSNSATIFESYAEREEQMRGLLDSFAEVSTTLSARNDEIEDAIVGLADGQEELRRFVETNEDEVRLLLDALEDLTDVTGQHHEELARTLRTGPRGFVSYHLISRTGQWFNIRAVGTSVADNVVSTERGAAYPREDGSASQGSSPQSALEQFFGGGQG